MEFKNIVPGMTFEKEFIVEEGDTASHFGNDKVPVFASPRLISWIEGTAIGTVAQPSILHTLPQHPLA